MEEQDKVENEWQKLYEERVGFLREIYKKLDGAGKIGILSNLERLVIKRGVGREQLPYQSILEGVESSLGTSEKHEPEDMRLGTLLRLNLRHDFPVILRKLREKKYTSREIVAASLGIHVRSYVRYENGETKKPHRSVIMALAKYFDVPLGTFYEK